MPPDITSQSASEGRKWTVMVYMGVDTIDGTASLEEAAKDDLTEMEYVGSGGALNVLVQRHDRGKSLRRHIGKGDWEDVPADQQDFAEGQALEKFIIWSLGKAEHDPGDSADEDSGDYSMLVLWGHAYDFTFGRAQRKNGIIDALDFVELRGVLKRLRERYGTQAKLDVLGFDACDLATVEMAYQLTGFTKYLLGSQIGIPIPGWPYDRVLQRLRCPFGRVMAPPEFGQWVVARFCEAYPASSPVSLSMLDLKRASELFSRAQDLSLALFVAMEDPDTVEQTIDLFFRSQTSEGRPYVDVADLCLSLTRESGAPDVVAAARRLGNFLITPDPPLVGKSATGKGRPFVVAHGRNAGETARLNGISIYAPHVVPSRDFQAMRPLYDNFEFVKQTPKQNPSWSELVHELAELS